MLKTAQILSRAMLILGVLVALTPCGLCQGAMEKPSSACSMKSMAGKMDCCNHKSKSSSPLCKVMNQSSTAAVSHGLDSVSVSVASLVLPLVEVQARVFSLQSTTFDTSPLRAPLALRI